MLEHEPIAGDVRHAARGDEQSEERYAKAGLPRKLSREAPTIEEDQGKGWNQGVAPSDDDAAVAVDEN